MIDLEKVQTHILQAAPVLGRESVPILDALGRVLARDIAAVEDLPASDISAMDGYAVRHSCLNGASPGNPTYFKIIGESPAGKPCRAVVNKKEAVRIMTGAVIPRGADTVVKLEDTVEGNGCIFCRKNPGYGDGIRFRGESLKQGEVVLSAGDIVVPPVIGVLASLRRAYVYVHRKPVVAIISTGDELSDFHEPPLPEKAMCSNLYALAAQAADLGARPLSLGIVQDNLQALDDILHEALHADVIITSGGTSKGRYDLVQKAFFSLGMKVRFSNIFEKPGKPTIFGIIRKKLVFGLPGNPTAAMLSFDQFIRPTLLKMMGHRNVSGACGKSGDPFSAVDSFDYRYGGNREHCRAPQVPLAGKCMAAVAHRGLHRKRRLKLAAR